MAAGPGIMHTGTTRPRNIAGYQGLMPLTEPVVRETRGAGLWRSNELERVLPRQAGEL